MAKQLELIPGEWYITAVCKNCGKRIAFLHDPSKGKLKITVHGKVEFSVPCSSCGHRAQYRIDELETLELPKASGS